MSAPNYEMSTWNDQYVAPQLEQEYGLDPDSFNPMPSDVQSSQFHRRQGTAAPPVQNASFPAFNPSFASSIQRPFTFSAQPPPTHASNMNQSHGNQNLFTPPSTGQLPNQQFGQGSLYTGSSPSMQAQQMTMTSNMYQEKPQVFTHTYPQSGLDMQSSSTVPNNVQIYHTPSPQPYTSPPTSFNQSFPGMDPQSTLQLQNPYFGSDVGRSVPDPYSGPAFKRPRVMDDVGSSGLYEFDTDQDVEEGGVSKEEAAKPKPPGACSRCKGLKVKCEFKTDPDTCKRCLNGGHECIIPGRKKRRAPPKREHLLSQIRQQADQITALMAQLEDANKKAQEVQTRPIDAASPSHTATTESFSLISASRLASPEVESDVPSIGSPDDVTTNADVQDWITKARESIEAFGGYISMGGPSATREMLAGEDHEHSESSLNDDAEFEFAVEDMDGEDAYDEAAVSGDDASVSTSRRVRLDSSTSERRLVKDRLATIPTEATPFGLMANLSLNKNRNIRKIKSKSDLGEEEEDDVGLANAEYFMPSSPIERPLTENHQPPHILRTGLVSPAEVEKLFAIYWDYMNLSLSLLDPVLYTAQKTYWRSPFLFTVICGIASKFYSDRPELYPQAMHYARLAAGTALIGGQKSVEVVHAYILLALYPVPARKWEDDRSWIYLGVAIRIAVDLNLHHPNTAKPQNEQHAREMLNRTRAWLNCFNLDRSTGSQYGKATIISNSDYTANRSDKWWNSSPYNMKGFDIHIAGYNADLTLMGQFRAQIHSDPTNPTGFNKNLDIAALASETDDELNRRWKLWSARIKEHNDPDDVQSTFRNGLMRLAYSYARMNVLSFGFQYAFGKASVGQDMSLLERCLRAAFDVLTAVLEDIAKPNQKIFLKHGPEAQSVFTVFACAFLIKLLQPRYSQFITVEQRDEIRSRVTQIAELFESPEVSIDDRHGPRLYARFLRGLLASRPKRQNLKAKSVSPAAQKVDLFDSPYPRQTNSTPNSARQSMEPDQHPQMYTQSFTMEPSDMSAQFGMNYSEYIAAPLPFESDLLQSMADPSVWPDMVMPGFSWMGDFQQSTMDAQMALVGAQQ